MGYLHARGIVHKDLNSKNLFVEKHRIVITDFGLLNVADTRSPLERYFFNISHGFRNSIPCANNAEI